MSIPRLGPFVRRPNGPLPAGFTYWATDHNATYVWNGGAWALAHSDPRLVTWETTLDWDRFTQVPITNIIGTTDLGVEPGGVGTVTSSDEHGSDRQIYVLDGFEASDMETRVEFSINSISAQIGLGMRVSETAPGFMGAVMPWTNVLFGANANVIPGIWEWDGGVDPNEFLNTNQQPGVLPSIAQEIISAEGDGSTVTVETVRPHMLSEIQGTQVKMNFGPYDNDGFAVTVVDATTFTFSDTASFGPVTAGHWDLDSTALPDEIHRGFAARVIGTEVTFKHWFPFYEPEPSWADPLRVRSYQIQDPLDSTRSLPGVGGAGLMFGHLADDGRIIKVNDYQVISLD